VQRYRFLDLWPCSPSELSSFEGGERIIEEEKKDSKPFAFDQQPAKPVPKEKFVKPDLAKFVRYKVEMGCTYTLPNNEKISLPPIVSQFLNSLPVGHWDGPTIDPDQLLKLISESALKVPATHQSGDTGQLPGAKRKLDEPEDGRPPVSDIYRDRQAAKMAKTANAEQQQPSQIRQPPR